MRFPDISPGVSDGGVLPAGDAGDAVASQLGVLLGLLRSALGTPLGQWSVAFAATVLVGCVMWERVERRPGVRPADPEPPVAGAAWFWDGLSDPELAPSPRVRRAAPTPRRPSQGSSALAPSRRSGVPRHPSVRPS